MVSIKQYFNYKFEEFIKKKRSSYEKMGGVLYYCPAEVRSIYEGGFYSAKDRDDYTESYLALINNLDEESIETINLILGRHEIVNNKQRKKINLFTDEEQRIIDHQRKRFYTMQPKVGSNVIACGGYVLSAPDNGMGIAETTVFMDKMGIKQLDNPEYFSNKDILDLGAYIGDSSLVLSRYTTENVYAFEPGKSNYEHLVRTIELNNNKRIIPILAGVGSKNGEAYIDPAFSMGLALGKCKDKMAQKVKVLSIDSFVEENNIEVGLIKVDIEGLEQDFLEGAKNTIRNQKPTLLLSMYHNASDFFNLKTIIESWNLGYKFKVHKEINEHIHYDTMLICEIDENL